MSTPKWKKFERIVAAIHVAEAKGATVTWNEDIGGRQFDVSIRFKSQFYNYLTLIECKDWADPVPAEKVDAFVTKSRKAGANKAIMVAASGFQDMALTVARENNIELFTLTKIQDMPEDMLTELIVSVLMIYPVGFIRSDNGELVCLSQDNNKLTYQMNNIKLSDMGGLSIGKVVEIYSQLLLPVRLPGVPDTGNTVKKATKRKQRGSFEFGRGTIATFPITNDEIPVSHFLYAYWMDTGRVMKPSPIDPTIFTDLGVKYDYRNDLTQESVIIPAQDLKLGFDTKWEAGRFYHNPRLKFAYYCHSITGDTAKIFLVESYQHGILMRAELEMGLDQQDHFLEITDKTEINRLRKLYEELVENDE